MVKLGGMASIERVEEDESVQSSGIGGGGMWDVPLITFSLHSSLDTCLKLVCSLPFPIPFFLWQRGKFFPQLTNLVRINTPKAVQTESRKAFRKLPNLEQGVSTLTNLKGVGTTLASGIARSCSSLAPPFLLIRAPLLLLV